MPLDELIPKLDDRRYADIVTEIRTRIARYAPEWRPGESAWTDVNDSDPGITLAQVFAWLADGLLYRLNQVPALNYIKFLQLLGIELRSAEPALAEVTLPVSEDYTDTTVIVPERTQISADPGDGEPPLIFETTRALIALRAKLDSVLAFDGYSYEDVSALNQEAVDGFQPYGPAAREGAELALGFIDPHSPPSPLPSTELDLAITVKRAPLKTQYLTCGIPDTSAYGPARIRWEYWNGSAWESLMVLKDETLAFTRSGHIYLKLPPKGISQQSKLTSDQTIPRYWIRARLERSQYERPPELLAIRTNTVGVEQGETVRDEVLGGSSGRPNQSFRLASTPVLKGSLNLEIQQSDQGYEPWTEVEDFFSSNPSDNHFVLNRSTGEVRTGDGVNGNIPVAYVDNPDTNVVARTYRFGGGKRGNVPAGSIKTLVSTMDGIDANGVTNLQAAHSGRDEEILEEVKKRAPRAIKSRCRAVTAEDYEYHAMQAGNVKRAKALPLFHPDFPGVKVPGVITVIVVPDSDEPAPEPSDGTLRTVCAYLDQRRLLTTELYVVKPVYQLVEVRGEVIVSGQADLAEVHKRIEETLLEYFHPLKGGEDGLGWPFGGTIFYSRVYQHVFTVPGVQSIQQLIIVADGEEMEQCRDVPILENGLVYSIQHTVQVRYSFEE